MIPAGRYLIECRASGRTARWPVVVTAGGDAKVTIDAALLAGLGDDEVLVPGGAVPLGEALELADARPPATTDVPAFVARRFPVTFGEYLEFVAAAGDAHAPRDDAGAPIRDVDPRVPVFGVTHASATAYAAWLAERTGVAWRLPTGDEWEKMARGADGRLYPWGDHFDAAFCKMRDSRPDAARPEPVGAFALDESPYGVRDLAGGVASWTAAADGATYARGGAWCDPRIDCRASVRRLYRAGEHAVRVGFRLVRS
jgi:serine/threonine-protein kinase